MHCQRANDILVSRRSLISHLGFNRVRTPCDTQEATRKDFFLVRQEGDRQVKRNVTCYNLDAIISVGYRVNSVLGVRFRQWATQVLKEFMLRGYAFNHRLNVLEDKMDRRLAKHDQDIVDLKDKVDFFVQTSQPPVRGVFYNGQVFDAHVFAAKFILSAKKSILPGVYPFFDCQCASHPDK